MMILLARRSKRVHERWKTKLAFGQHFPSVPLNHSLRFYSVSGDSMYPLSSWDTCPNLPELITDSIRDRDIRQLSHHAFRCLIHEVDGIAIIRLLELILVAKSEPY